MLTTNITVDATQLEKIVNEAIGQSRFCLVRDNDAHWYLIPAAKRAEWNEWLNIPEEDERSWDAPEFSESIDGPHNLTFASPSVR